MKSQENLQSAFAGESQANRKYTAFAKKADEDGFPTIAKLFRATADAETIHALAELRAMGGVKTTAENLEVAIGGEQYEYTKMYPEFLTDAQNEDNKPAILAFRFAKAAEEVHYNLYKQALAAVQAGKDIPNAKIYLCPICGHIEIGEAPEKCPICNAPKSKYVEIQ